MKKNFSVCALLIAACPLNSWAEWTGDSYVDYYSNEVVSDFHVGQYNGGTYFCIKTVKKSGGGKPVIACLISNSSIWSSSFNTMLEQARHFYITRQPIRVYVKPNVWTDKRFTEVFSTNALAGLSSCSSATVCFGPGRSKPVPGY